MQKKQTGRWLIGLMVIALIAVAAVIVYKTREYAAGDAFYDSLRGLR